MKKANTLMLRNVLVAIGTVVVVGLGIVFQVTATTSHEVKEERPASQTTQGTGGEITDAPSAPDTTGETPAPSTPSDEREGGDTNDQSGKPGEVKG